MYLLMFQMSCSRISSCGRGSLLMLRICVFQSKGAKEKVLTRIIVSRCEVDLKKIRQEFKAHHGKSLYQTIAVR